MEKAKAFTSGSSVLDRLGAPVRRGGPDTCRYRSPGALHLSEHHGDCCPGSTVYLQVTGLADYHKEISAKGYGSMRPGLEKTFHNSTCMEVIDPFGNRLRFDESLAA